MVRQLENNGSVRVDRISPADLANLTKWFGKEIGVLQSIYHPDLRIVVGEGKTVGGKQVRPGETFVVHTHPVYTSLPSHFGKDIPAMANAGKKVEGVIDLSGQIIFFDKSGVLNPRNDRGELTPMHPEFNSGFIDKACPEPVEGTASSSATAASNWSTCRMAAPRSRCAASTRRATIPPRPRTVPIPPSMS